MTVWQARTRETPLVDEREHGAVAGHSLQPGFGDELDLSIVQVREGAEVVGSVDHDLLALERRVEVGHHPDPPRVADPQRLGRCPVLPTGTERAPLQLLLGRGFDLRQPGAGPVASRRREDDTAARQQVEPNLGQVPGPPRAASISGRKSSIGSGRMIVDDRSELISSIVWRNRSWSDMGFSARTTAASLSRSEAWNSPSAAITFARRSRSASACRAIARCIPPGISTSLTSTIETLTPHGEVASSMIRCRISLILSRSDRSSSSWCWPRTLRSVVCAICEVATMKFSTCTIAFSGSMMRKYATAFTRTGTLSLVMTSCGGMLSVTVRRSTRTILSTIGMRRKRPGPLGGECSRPSRKMTPRSYSRAIRIDADRRNSRMTTTAAIAIRAAVIGLLLRAGAPSYAVAGA